MGQTLIDEDEREGLLIPNITTRGELNEFEQLNIENALKWTLVKKFKQTEVLSESFVKKLHFQMLGEVWSWAGTFRRTNKNMGVDKLQIGEGLRSLCSDCAYWIEHETYVPDEIVVRMKHRMVSIHPFPNGNGRHSRLMADVVAQHIFGNKSFSWGRGLSADAPEVRQHYLDALRKADNNDISDLIAFAKS